MTREALIEVMARAICKAMLETGRTDWGGPIPAPDYYGASRAALVALEAAGVRLVPVEAFSGPAAWLDSRFDDLRSQLVATRERVSP